MLQNAPPCLSRPNGMGGDECSDFQNPIGRTFLSGKRISAETGKSRLSVKLAPWAGSFTTPLGHIDHKDRKTKKDAR
jgi:hypothetical protein